MLDGLDSQILHAIQIAPRHSFRAVADLVGSTEQTVARRFRRMQRDGVVRVVGLLEPRAHGEANWLARIRAKPDDLRRVADALVRRPDVTHANVHSNWTELVCLVRAPLGVAEDGLLQRLPRTTALLSLDVELLLHTFGTRATACWTGYGATLGSAQVAELLAGAPRPTEASVLPEDSDRALFEALFDDGRASLTRLAEATGWSAARVARRMATLEAGGALGYDVDILPERIGFHVNAMVWLTAAPRHVHGVGEQLAAHPEVASVSAVSGRDNVMAIVVCRDVDQLYRYLSESLSAVDDISGYHVSIRTQRLKQVASLVAHGRLVTAASASGSPAPSPGFAPSRARPPLS